MVVCWMQSRYDKGDGADYVNCPLNEEQYRAFVAALLAGEKTDFKEWETSTPYFEGCLPVEVMAARGIDTLRYGPMKPVGLSDARTARGLTPWCSFVRTMRWARYGTWWAFRPS